MSTDITSIFIPAPDSSWLITVDLDGVEIQRLLGWLHPSDDDNGVGQPVIVRDTPPVTEVVEPYWSFRLEALYGISKTDANEYCDLHRDTWSELVAQRMDQARQRLAWRWRRARSRSTGSWTRRPPAGSSWPGWPRTPRAATTSWRWRPRRPPVRNARGPKALVSPLGDDVNRR